MKRCPKCGQTYADQDINFCLNDGELLSRSTEPGYKSPFDSTSQRSADDSPPTMILDQARITNPIGWNNPPASPVVPWQKAQPAIYPFIGQSSPSQVFGIISLGVGVASMTIGFCCYSGILLSPIAIVLGIIALVQNRNDPSNYGGKGFAIAGIATGLAYFVLMLIFIIIWGALSFI